MLSELDAPFHTIARSPASRVHSLNRPKPLHGFPSVVFTP